MIKPGVSHNAGKVVTDNDDDDDDEAAFSTVDALLDLIRWEESVYSDSPSWLLPLLISLHV